ncbi:sodium:proline symporter [Sulfitobacter mediterraneus]|uniref:sodium:proline symporter n=1 Tax=Sulfitobacter mediterraneus TaxID=83219 RepID=UPI0019317959|nr:sodium:proline symporter [Sulfitobacter mediterraneus]MBM1632381.1 sodium:proline symporter [Sulfitobacter mediterraneus]MBM1640198.1 sodium:proline symporter [Sulfitobacter mediterraneus]MBM1644246.1 sodium:proline symporter [Sulfitobacter mediterraneus]MBM1648293.1 sodium:proline symporter [Sulfitobacter mediterraneus]MBM1652338.1 sodium:proline symporter [Sulfitobacter mediterraneus]
MQTPVLIALFAAVLVASLLVAPRRASVEGFFGGQGVDGRAPGLWVLVLSQVTTWIFARSLMNAAILGYYYGIAGTLAYAAYYGSFLTGGYIVGHLRRGGAGSVQDWLQGRFGAVGTGCYNLVIALRLLSEVFANLLVVGLIFNAVLAGSGTGAILIVAVLGLAYSAWGGLSAALRTDVLQMAVFLVVFGLAFGALLAAPGFDLPAVLTAPGVSGAYNGWVLLLVAGLQVFSYPAHDPVMMDRGFIADPATTQRSFLHAFWISTLCIIGFGFFGIQAGLSGADYEGQLIGTWALMFPPWVFVALMISLLVSALSTLDSALSSAARLVVEELRLAPRSLGGGRIVMLVFMTAGTVLTLWGNATLFDAVAVSGTASMFLTPVLIVGLVMGRPVALWAYLVAFGAAILGAFAYFARSWPTVAAFLPEGHKYEQLLVICVVVLVAGFAAVLAGMRRG